MKQRALLISSGALAAALLTSCITGERPTLAEGSTTGSAPVDAVLDRLAGIGGAVYTAEYDVRFAGSESTTEVTATQASPSRRSLTSGDVRYLADGQTTETCTMSSGECVDTLDTRVGDVQLTPNFFSTGLASRIRRDASRAIAEPTGSTEQLDDHDVVCAAIPVDGGTNTYCVLDDGVLARLDATDLEVTITSYADEADESLLSPP